MTNTTHYNLKKPEDNDNVLIGDLNENADAIDQALHGLEEGKAARAKPAKAGSLAALDESGNLTDSGRTPGAAGGVATLDEGGKVPGTQLPAMNYDPAGSADKVQKALDSHTGNKQNPHGVTAKQAGADPAGTAASAVAAHNQNGEAHPALQAKLNGVSMTAKATYPVAEGQTIQAGDVVDIVGGQVQGNKKPLSQYTEGSLITLNENGSSVGFYVAKINYTSGGTLVVRKGSAGKVVWNTSPNTLHPSSNIISWLNSTYLNQLDPSVASSIMNISWSYISSASTVGNTTVKVGLLSPYEYGITSLPIGAAVLGTVLPAGSTISSSLTSIKWTRQAYPNQYNGVLYVSGSSCSSGSADNSYDIQPAFCLPNSFIATSYDTVPSQAIALQSGTAGQNIEVIYSGTVAADWVTEGQIISSAGVYGAGVLDGVLQVWSKDRPGMVIETGSYIGTGTYGAALSTYPTSITFSSPVSLVIIVGYEISGQYRPLVQDSSDRGQDCFPIIPCFVLGNDYMQSYGPYYNTDLSAPFAKISEDRKTVTWYNTISAEGQLNYDKRKYFYIGFCEKGG